MAAVFALGFSSSSSSSEDSSSEEESSSELSAFLAAVLAAVLALGCYGVSLLLQQDVKDNRWKAEEKQDEHDEKMLSHK